MIINLVLILEHLAAAMTWCKIHRTEHGSDHYAIEMTFDLANPMEEHIPRLAFKDALWEELRQRVVSTFTESPRGGLMPWYQGPDHHPMQKDDGQRNLQNYNGNTPRSGIR
jgi:hypothetical protein